jgi:hypothetical protein
MRRSSRPDRASRSILRAALSVALRSKPPRRPGLLTADHNLNCGIVQSVESSQVGLAGYAVDVADALNDELVDENLAAGSRRCDRHVSRFLETICAPLGKVVESQAWSTGVRQVRRKEHCGPDHRIVSRHISSCCHVPRMWTPPQLQSIQGATGRGHNC